MALPCRKATQSRPEDPSVVGGPSGASIPLGSCFTPCAVICPDSSRVVTCERAARHYSQYDFQAERPTIIGGLFSAKMPPAFCSCRALYVPWLTCRIMHWRSRKPRLERLLRESCCCSALLPAMRSSHTSGPKCMHHLSAASAAEGRAPHLLQHHTQAGAAVTGVLLLQRHLAASAVHKHRRHLIPARAWHGALAHCQKCSQCGSDT